jgi:CheY-like chemotaxis protein
VIDDEPSVRDLLSRTLRKEGFGVVTASGGTEGLALARTLHPQVITLDVLMPDLDGWTVLSELKADPVTHDIPVIMLSIIEDKNRGYALDAADYLTKPVDRDRLITVLRKHSEERTAPVLVVDDDGDTREWLRRMLELDGRTVREAANGREALEAVRSEPPSVILLDLMMPELDGFAVVEALRGHEEWRSIPVVILTAKDITAADRLRLNGYVLKIIQKGAMSGEELLADIRQLVAVSVRGREKAQREKTRG